MFSPEVVRPAGPARRLGVDIGRVIMRSDTDNPDRSIFGSDFLNSPAVDGAIDTLRELSTGGDWAAIHLVSKCQPPVQARTLQWLDAQDFYGRTGIDRSNVHFCLERKEKGAIASKLLLTHFVDDRQDVLQAMPPRVAKRVLFEPSAPRPLMRKDNLFVARNWDDVALILK